MKNNRTTLTGILALLFCASVLTGYVVIHKFISSAHSALLDEYTTLSQLRLEEQRALGAESLVHSLEDDVIALEKYVVREGGLVDFIQTIESLSDASGATVEVMSVEVEGNEEGVSELLLRFEGRGTWEEVTHLLVLTEVMPVRSGVVQTTLRGGGNEWSLSTTLETPLFEGSM